VSPRRYRVVTPEEAAEIVRLYQDGAPMAGIAEIMDMSRGQVDRILKREGVERDRRKLLDGFGRAEVIRRYEEGESQGSLAKTFGISEKAISNALASAKVDKRHTRR